MSKIKLNRVRKMASTARYPRSFDARLASIPAPLLANLTAAQIAAIIDGPMASSHAAGHTAGYRDAQ